MCGRRVCAVTPRNMLSPPLLSRCTYEWAHWDAHAYVCVREDRVREQQSFSCLCSGVFLHGRRVCVLPVCFASVFASVCVCVFCQCVLPVCLPVCVYVCSASVFASVFACVCVCVHVCPALVMSSCTCGWTRLARRPRHTEMHTCIPKH